MSWETPARGRQHSRGESTAGRREERDRAPVPPGVLALRALQQHVGNSTVSALLTDPVMVQRDHVATARPRGQAVVSGPAVTVMRRLLFESTIEIRRRLLESRRFRVTAGGLRIVVLPSPVDSSVPNARDFSFGVTLTREYDWWPDDEIGTCEAMTGGPRTFAFANLPSGTYYLTIWRTFDHPHCPLLGDVLVFDEAVAADSAGCQRDHDMTALEVVHLALDAAGFIPVLGAVPDGVNAAIYAVEGDWPNAGLSAVAMVPAWGDGVKLGVVAGRSSIKISEKAAFRLGEEGIAKGLKEVKAASRTERSAAREALTDADGRALDETFTGGRNEGAFQTSERLKRGNLGERLATDALARDGHTILNYKPDILGTNQGGIDMVTMRDGFVYFVDNKALSRSGNVSSVSALTTNFPANRATALEELQGALAHAHGSSERAVLARAIAAIQENRVKRAVTNANLTSDSRILSGVTDRLAQQGIEFIDVMR
ncbi:hypothetical protein GCM10009583_01990 [Ornithinicoccus hortensis]